MILLFEQENAYIESKISEVKCLTLIQEGILYISGSNIEDFQDMGKRNDLDCWLRKANSLLPKIKQSLFDGMKSSNISDFNPTDISEEVYWAYFHNENAIFRLACLWDVLAQICNEFFDLGYQINRVSYKQVFNNERCKSNDKDFIKVQDKISAYFKEDDNTKVDGIDKPWSGNHEYISNIRNKFTHRNDPHIMHFFNNGIDDGEKINIPDHPIFELKRITEDYIKCFGFLKEVNTLIINKYGSFDL